MAKKRISITVTKESKKFLSGNSSSETHHFKRRALEIDGAYFEAYKVLEEKQKERVIDARRKSVIPKLLINRNSGRNPSHSLDTKEEIELYKTLIYTNMHRFGKEKYEDDTLRDEELFAYGREVFNIGDTKHKQIYKEIKDLEPPECLVNVEVIAGNGLDPKDPNGFSDPYCMLCLINSDESESCTKKKKIRDFCQRDKVAMTKVIKNTLNPVWKERFKFDVNDIQKQVLRIDVWDKYDNSVGLRGAGRNIKDMDDFIGHVEVPLKTITDYGIDTSYQLEGREPKKKVNGKLHLKLSLRLKLKDTNKTLTHISSHSSNQIYKSFLTGFTYHHWQNLTQTSNNKVTDQTIDKHLPTTWDCKLCQPAEIILLQFVMCYQTNPLSISVIRWQVYSRLYTDVAFPLDFLVEILASYQENSNNNDEENMEEDSEIFFRSLDDFVNYSNKLIAKYRYTFNSENPANCVELGKLIMCLMMIYKFPIYKARFPGKSLKDDLENIILESTKCWFYQIRALFKSNGDTPSDRLDNMIYVTNAINADLQTGNISYEPVFKLIRIKYFPLVFNGIESMLSELIERGTKFLKKELRDKITKEEHEDGLGTKMFELYIGIRDLCGMKLTIPEKERSAGGISYYRFWFREGVVKWIHLAAVKAKARIKRAIELDEVRVIDDMVKHSTSAVDVTWCLSQICIFWKRLDWPDPSDAFMFLTQITEVVGECGMYYADIIFNQLVQKGFFNDIGQFDITDQLCTMMNDVAHVIDFLNCISDVLGYEKILNDMAELHGHTQTIKLKETLENIMKCAKDDMENKIKKILKHVGERLKESLYPYVIKITQDQGKTFESLSDPLLEYIDSNLVTLNITLLTQVFDRVVLHFWEDFLCCVLQLIEWNRRTLTTTHYTTLGDVVQLTEQFFHGDNSGLSFDVLHSDTYQELQDLINLNTHSTKELIQKFFCERCEEQKNVDSSLGSITFKIFYCNTTKKLNIYILNCKNLLPMDFLGTSDPYVTMMLKPDHLFPGINKQRTKTIKNTLFPLYDEIIQFDINAADCSREGATLLLTLFDYDMFSNDDICGEIYYALKNVLGIGCPVQDGFINTPQIELPLHIIPLEGKTVEVMMNRRKHDLMASNFIAQHKECYRRMAGNIRKGKQRIRKK